jgi:hypothetical protein
MVKVEKDIVRQERGHYGKNSRRAIYEEKEECD